MWPQFCNKRYVKWFWKVKNVISPRQTYETHVVQWNFIKIEEAANWYEAFSSLEDKIFPMKNVSTPQHSSKPISIYDQIS